MESVKLTSRWPGVSFFMSEIPDIATKQEFAALVGVTPSCVSQWIARGKISGDALVGRRGCRSSIRVEVAR
jgi:hypothetical protein